MNKLKRSLCSFLVLVFLLAIPAKSNELLDGLVSYWKLDEASGNAVDSHTGSNDGTVTGATYGATGLINDAFSFDGTNDYVAIGNPANLQLQAMSISCWVNTSSNTRSIITKGNNSRGDPDERDWDIYGNGTNLIFAISNGSGYIATAAAAWPDMSSGFHHIVCTWDGTTGANKVIIYVDGNSFATDTASATNNANANILYLGGKESTAAYEFSGTLDEVGIWNVELSSTKVTALYNSGSGLAYGSFTASGGLSIPIAMYHYRNH
jgi:hypothetical protein